MTNTTKEFLRELAALMKKYNVDISGSEAGGYYLYCDGIEFTVGAGYEIVKLGRYIDGNDILKVIKD